MRKPEHFFAPGVIESHKQKPTRVDTFSRYLLAVAALLALAVATGQVLGYVEIYGGLL